MVALSLPPPGAAAETAAVTCGATDGRPAALSVRLTLPAAAEAFAVEPSAGEEALAAFLERHAGSVVLLELAVSLPGTAGPGRCEGNLRSVESDTLLLRLAANRLLVIVRRPKVRPDSCRPVPGGFRWSAPVRVGPPPADASLEAWTLREAAADPPGLDAARSCLAAAGASARP